MATENNAQDFTDFEKQGWEHSADSYHQLLGVLTGHTIDPVLKAVSQPKQLSSLLDVATGPGYLATRAREYGYEKIVGIDFSEAMVALANAERKHKLPNANNLIFKVGNAEQLDEAEASFDAVTMNFGLLHLARPQQAIAEAYRVLKSGGRFAFTVWAEPERSAGFAVLLNAINVFADNTIVLPEGPPFFYFGDESNSRQALQEAGFMDIAIQAIPFEWKVNSGEEFFMAFLNGTARTGGLLRLQSADTLHAIKNKIITACEFFKRNGVLYIPMCAVLVVGTKPI